MRLHCNNFPACVAKQQQRLCNNQINNRTIRLIYRLNRHNYTRSSSNPTLNITKCYLQTAKHSSRKYLPTAKHTSRFIANKPNIQFKLEALYEVFTIRQLRYSTLTQLLQQIHTKHIVTNVTRSSQQLGPTFMWANVRIYIKRVN